MTCPGEEAVEAGFEPRSTHLSAGSSPLPALLRCSSTGFYSSRGQPCCNQYLTLHECGMNASRRMGCAA